MIANVPAGLSVRNARPNALGIVFFADCEMHAGCVERGMVFSAASHEELTERVFPKFAQHCKDMEQWA